MPRRFAFGSLTVVACLAWLAAVHGADQPIDAVRLVIKESKTGKETLIFVSKDPGFLFPVPGSDDDPVVGTPGGLVIDLLALEDTATQTVVIPGGEGVAGWTVKEGKRSHFKFSNKKAPNEVSPVKVALLKDGKVLKIVSKEAGFSPLVVRGGVAVRVTSGALRNCAVFGPGTIKTAKERKLVAKGASRTGFTDCSDEALRGAVTTTTTIAATSTTVAGSTTTSSMRWAGRKPSLAYSIVSGPPPFTARSYMPSARERVPPNSGCRWMVTRAPASGAPSRMVTLPRMTATRTGSITPSATPNWMSGSPA